MNIYEETVDAINKAAQEVGAEKSEFTTAMVRQWIETNMADDWPRLKNSFQNYYSRAVSGNTDCLVEKVPGQYSYRLALISEEETVETTSDVSENTKGKVQREIKLYGVLQDWLISRGFEAELTFNKKKGGRWGNPDVTGLRLEELPTGPTGIECATIEAKLSLTDWQYFLFEAVAHKRFAHRAWFAFAVGSDSPDLSQIKESDRLAGYAEKYRVGILVVFLPVAKYEQLSTGDANSLEVGPDDVRVEVLWPAMYEGVQTSALGEFMTDVLEIRSHTEFSNFGR